MANKEQLAVLRRGVDAWNAWREENRGLDVDLCGADLTRVNLSKANLNRANLRLATLSGAHLIGTSLIGADLFRAKLVEAKLHEAKLMGVNLFRADLSDAQLSGASLTGGRLDKAILTGANLYETHFTSANLTGANLFMARLVKTNFTDAVLTGCQVYGISAWSLKLDGAEQKDLIITPPGEPEITVDNLEVAQFIYLLLNNERVRHVIDTITSKVVLIPGRFTPERMAVLHALRDELRQRDYTPVLFVFDKPSSRSTLETVSTLAHMARFVIADLTDAKSVLQELQAIVPTNPSVPVQPLILATQEEPGMFDFFRKYPWVLEPCRYPDPTGLLVALTDRVIAPAELTLSKR